ASAGLRLRCRAGKGRLSPLGRRAGRAVLAAVSVLLAASASGASAVGLAAGSRGGRAPSGLRSRGCRSRGGRSLRLVSLSAPVSSLLRAGRLRDSPRPSPLLRRRLPPLPLPLPVPLRWRLPVPLRRPGAVFLSSL